MSFYSSPYSFLSSEVADWFKDQQDGFFSVPWEARWLTPGLFDPGLISDIRSWLAEETRFLLGLEWNTRLPDRFLRFYSVEVGLNKRVYFGDSDCHFPDCGDGVRLLACSSLAEPDVLFLRRLFRSNGAAFGLILLPDVPGDVESKIEDFGELLDLFSSGFSSGDLWETLQSKHPHVWNEVYENPVKMSHHLAHRLHNERIQAQTRQANRVVRVTGWQPDEQSLLEAHNYAAEALRLRCWSSPEEKRRIVARYLCDVLHY